MMSEWIEVEDKLPDWYQWVHVWSKHWKQPMMTRRIETGYKDADGESEWRWDWSRYVGLIDHGVNHWMPMPGPPEQKT